MLTNRLSYVFGPLIEQLREVGYTDRMIGAAPYDWRLPPAHLEHRDRFFTKLITQIEQVSSRWKHGSVKPISPATHAFPAFCVCQRGAALGGQRWPARRDLWALDGRALRAVPARPGQVPADRPRPTVDRQAHSHGKPRHLLALVSRPAQLSLT